jgi:galactitol-specific phosphotransferase system IIB component
LEVASEALTQFGSFVISDVVKPALDLERRSIQIANSSQGQVTAKQIQDTVKAALLKHNIDSNVLLEGVGEFQDLTGQAKLGFDMIDTIATVAKGRGFDAKELFSLAGSITSEGDTAKDVQEKFLSLLAQGDAGSIPLKTIANLGGKLSAVGASFVGTDKSKLAMSAALLQTAKPKIGTADESMTALQAFTRESLKAGKKLGKGTVVKDVSGVEQIADPAALLEKLFLKTSGNKGKLEQLGYTDTSTTFIGAYKDVFMKRFADEKAAGKKDKEAKEEAARAVGDFVRNLAKANTTMQAETKKEEKVRKTPAEQLEDGMNIIKTEIAKAMPEIVKSISLFVKMAPQLGKAGRTLAELFVNLMNAMTPLFRLLGLLDDQAPTKTTIYALDAEGNVTDQVIDPMQFEGAKYTRDLNLSQYNNEPIKLSDNQMTTSEGVPYMIAAPEAFAPATPAATGNNLPSGTLQLTVEQAERLGKALAKAADGAEDLNRKKPLSER